MTEKKNIRYYFNLIKFVEYTHIQQDGYPLTDDLFRDIVNRRSAKMADSGDPVDSYVDTIVRYSLLSDAMRTFDNSDTDYDAIVDDTSNENDHQMETNHAIPSIRDPENLQHSSLWSYNPDTDGIIKSAQMKPQYKARIKNEASLPAYCNPPNPCPVGYTEEQQCTTDFENTSAFSRDYQAAQECMCDHEHMFNCPSKETTTASNTAIDNDTPLDIDSDVKMLLSKQFELIAQQHKNLVASPDNPYLIGDKLPNAAKKGALAY